VTWLLPLFAAVLGGWGLVELLWTNRATRLSEVWMRASIGL